MAAVERLKRRRRKDTLHNKSMGPTPTVRGQRFSKPNAGNRGQTLFKPGTRSGPADAQDTNSPVNLLKDLLTVQPLLSQ